MQRNKSNNLQTRQLKFLRGKSSNVEGKITEPSPVKSLTISNNEFTNVFPRTIFRGYQHINNAYILHVNQSIKQVHQHMLTISPLPKHTHTFELPLRYMRIHFTCSTNLQYLIY